MVFLKKYSVFLKLDSGENLLGTCFVHTHPLSTSPNFFKAPSYMLYEFWFIIDDIIFPAENFFSSQFHYPSLVMIVKKNLLWVFGSQAKHYYYYYFNYYLSPAWVNHDGAKKVHFVVQFIISNLQISQSSMDKYRMPGDIQILYNQHNSTS